MPWRRRAPPLLASAAAGALAVTGFAPFGFWPGAILGLAVLFALFNRTTAPGAGFALGFAWGLGFFLTGVSWVYVSLSVYGGMPAWLAGLATFLFCAVLALFPAAVGAVQANARLSPTLRLLLLTPLAWGVTEWVRGWLFTGFPWLVVGYTQVPSAPLAGYAPIVGVYGVSFLVAAVAALIAWAVAPRRKTAHRALAGAAVAVTAAGGMLLESVDWTMPDGRPTSVMLVQGNIPQELKWRPEKAHDTLEHYARLVAAAPAELIVLPETALPFFESDLPAEYREALTARVRDYGGDLLTGLPTGSLDDRYYNSVVSLGTAPSQRYHKVHLVPFGEYIPLKPVWGWVLDVLHIPLSDFSRGETNQVPLAIGGQRVAANVCYEDAFGEEIIRQLPAASVLVNVSNLAWFGDSFAPWQHAQMSQMRALETGRMMLRSTNTGLTAIIDQKGRLVASLPLFTTATLAGSIQGYAGSTPYVRWGNVPVLALWAALAAGLAAAAFRRRP